MYNSAQKSEELVMDGNKQNWSKQVLLKAFVNVANYISYYISYVMLVIMVL
jgi:hypothetical protein